MEGRPLDGKKHTQKHVGQQAPPPPAPRTDPRVRTAPVPVPAPATPKPDPKPGQPAPTPAAQLAKTGATLDGIGVAVGSFALGALLAAAGYGINRRYLGGTGR